MAKHILVPIDDSPRASAVLAELSLVCDRRDQIVLLSVAKPIAGPRNAAALVHQKKDLDAFLDAKADELRARGFHVRTEAVINKDPARAIVDFARRTRPNLIAMVRRTHDPRRHIFGSVTSDVVKSDIAPVVLLPPGSGR
jgi:nucleotide-binding universal stress UspA family protein